MAIILLTEEVEYLKKLLKRQEPWWVRDKLLEKIEDEIAETKNRQKCNHEYGEFKGSKVCCIHCGGYAEGMGFEWEFLKKVDPKDYEIPKYQTPLEALIKP